MKSIIAISLMLMGIFFLCMSTVHAQTGFWSNEMAYSSPSSGSAGGASQPWLMLLFQETSSVQSGVATIQSRDWNDNDGFVFDSGQVVVAGGGDKGILNSADFYVEINMLSSGAVGVIDLGVTSLNAITSVPTTGYSTEYFSMIEIGHVYAFQLVDSTYAIIEFTELGITSGGDYPFHSTFNYKYQPNGTPSFN